jgi:transposase-like protein
MQDAFVKCSKCGSYHIVKAGFVYGTQRYLCKECGFHFTLNRKGVDNEIKRLAVHLYIEGMGYRAISRITGISDVAIAKWISPMKENLLPFRKGKARLNELHKLEHFFITKELFNQYGWLLIGIEENSDICLLGSYTTGNCKLTIN